MVKIILLSLLGLIIVSNEGDKISIKQHDDPFWKEKVGIYQTGPNSWTNIDKEKEKVIIIDYNGKKVIKNKE